MTIRRVLPVLGLAMAAALPRLAAQSLRPLGIEEALGALAINGRMPVALSSDGEWVAYTVYDSRRRTSPGDERYKSFSRTGAFSEAEGCDLWLTSTRTSETRKLGETGATTSNPVWSPDSRWLAFYSDRGGTYGLWVYERATGRSRQLSRVIPRPFFGFAGVRWSADSKRVVLKALPEGMTVARAADLLVSRPKATSAREAGSTVVVYEARAHPTDAPSSTQSPAVVADSGLLARYMADIVVVDVPSGSVHRVALGAHAVGFWISPDGRDVAYTELAGFVANTQQAHYRLMVSPVSTPRPTALVPVLPQEYGVAVSWSPNGKTIAYTTFGQKVVRGEAYIVPVAGGDPRVVSAGDHPTLGSSYRAPAWDSAGTHLYFVASRALWQVTLNNGATREVGRAPGRDITEVVAYAQNAGRVFTGENGRVAYVTTRDNATKRVGFARVDLASGRTTQLFERDQFFNEGLWSIDVSRDGHTLVWVAQDAQHAEEIWRAGTDVAEPKQLTHINPTLEHVAFGASQLVMWTGARGDTLRGALIFPAGYERGRRYPLVVKLYAGSMLSNNVNRFGGSGPGVENFQLLATRGYAILLPDVPQHLGTPMTDIAAAVMPGVDSVIAMGVADSGRLGITGHSYGGYSTLSMIVQTPRFRAAVSSAGPADLVSMYASMAPDGGAFGVGWSETGQGLMGGTPWEYRGRYIDNSPFMQLDRVQTPLLVVQGGIDHTVPPWQSDAVFVALRRLGKEVTYARYEGEDHWEGTWGLPNAVDYWKRVIGWFDAHLKDGEAATSSGTR